MARSRPLARAAIVALLAGASVLGGGAVPAATAGIAVPSNTSATQVTCCATNDWTVEVETGFGNVTVKVSISGIGGGHVCVSRVVVGTSPGAGGLVGGVVSKDPPPNVQANCGYTVTSSALLSGLAQQLGGRTLYVQVETVSSPAAKIRGEEPKVTAAKTVTVPGAAPATPKAPATPAAPAKPGSPTKGVRTAKTATLPPDNGTAACRSARQQIDSLNRELVKAVKNWNFTVGRKGSSVQLEQIGTRIKRVEGKLKNAAAAGKQACQPASLIAECWLTEDPNAGPEAKLTRIVGTEHTIYGMVRLQPGASANTGVDWTTRRVGGGGTSRDWDVYALRAGSDIVVLTLYTPERLRGLRQHPQGGDLLLGRREFIAKSFEAPSGPKGPGCSTIVEFA